MNKKTKNKVEIIPAKKNGFVVFYCKDLVMRERIFKQEEQEQANDFCKEVNGSICELALSRK